MPTVVVPDVVSVPPEPLPKPQRPALHVEPDGHTVPHAPQFAASVCRFASQPFTAEPSQLPKFVVHAPMAQAPPEHAAAALA